MIDPVTRSSGNETSSGCTSTISTFASSGLPAGMRMSPSDESVNASDTVAEAGLAETCRSGGGQRSITTTASVAMLDSVIHVARQVRTKRETMGENSVQNPERG